MEPNTKVLVKDTSPFYRNQELYFQFFTPNNKMVILTDKPVDGEGNWAATYISLNASDIEKL